MIELVCASANPDKVAEMAGVLDGHAVLLPRPDGMGDVAEDADDLTGNARLKARAVCRFAGAAALADDTGLEVDALGGAPGVHSARYAGRDASYADNLARLMADMRAVPPEQRTARFRTVVMVCFPDGSELAAAGVVEGVITVEPRGAGGFGYDPVFAPVEAGGRTFAEMGASAKNAMSHRARALRALLEVLKSQPGR
jgi:XTP/dITP diphosphohydrolase